MGWIVIVERDDGMLSIYGRYLDRTDAEQVQEEVGGTVITFEEYQQKYL